MTRATLPFTPPDNNSHNTPPITTNMNSQIILEASSHEEVTGPQMEIKFTVRRPGKGRLNTLCTLIGKSQAAGSINTSREDKSMFINAWLRPFVWAKEGGVQVEPGTNLLVQTELNASIVKSVKLDEKVAAALALVKQLPVEFQALAIGQLDTDIAKAVGEALKGSADGFERKKLASMATLLDRLFGHQNVRVKSTLYGEFAKIGNKISELEWVDDDDRAKEYSLIVRFPLVDGLNTASQMKEMKGPDDAPRCIPGTDVPIRYKEITVYPSYMALVKGIERFRDTTKMVDADLVQSAVDAALAEDSTIKTYMSRERLKAEADSVNEWKTVIAAKGGKKVATAFKSELFGLVPAVAQGDAPAVTKAKVILKAVKAVAQEGHAHLTVEKAEGFEKAFDKAVTEAQAPSDDLELDDVLVMSDEDWADTLGL